jgi:hypothetical protein
MTDYNCLRYGCAVVMGLGVEPAPPVSPTHPGVESASGSRGVVMQTCFAYNHHEDRQYVEVCVTCLRELIGRVDDLERRLATVEGR